MIVLLEIVMSPQILKVLADAIIVNKIVPQEEFVVEIFVTFLLQDVVIEELVVVFKIHHVKELHHAILIIIVPLKRHVLNLLESLHALI